MKEITLSPATLCLASLLIAILADEARQIITFLCAPRPTQPVHNLPINYDECMVPSFWVRVSCAPLDTIAFALLAIGFYHTSGVGMWLVNLLSAAFLALVYVGIPKFFLDVFPSDNASDKAKTRRERYYAKRIVVLAATLIYRAAVYFAGLEPSQLWLWIIAFMLFSIAFLRSGIEHLWTRLGYDIEGVRDEQAFVIDD